MIESRISSRYARALLDNANNTHCQDQVKSDADNFLVLVKEERQLLNVLRSPVVAKEIKYRIVSRVFDERFQQLTVDFIRLVIRKRRERYLVDMFILLIRFYNIENNISTATITTAGAVDEQLIEQARKIISEFTNTTVILSDEVDESLIGGFVLSFSDKKFDASIASQLNSIKKELAN